MFCLTFAVNGGSIDQECLRYQGQAISHIRERMSSLNEAASEATIGAILLLAGVEVRLSRSLFIHDISGCRPLRLNHLGSTRDDVSGWTSYGRSAATTWDLSKARNLSHQWNQASHILVSQNSDVLARYSYTSHQAGSEFIRYSEIQSHSWSHHFRRAGMDKRSIPSKILSIATRIPEVLFSSRERVHRGAWRHTSITMRSRRLIL